jgi:ResB-like family
MNQLITRTSIPKKVFGFLASFGLAVVVLSFLLLLTWLGTLEQTRMGLYDVQKKYFDSLFCFYDLGPLKIPLPGVYLLLGILFVNLLCGGLIRIRKNWRLAGIIIAHFSILFLIVAGWVSYHFKKEGHLRLFEGQSSGIFTSYHNRLIEIAEVGSHEPVLTVREKKFDDVKPGRKRTFVHSSLPFDLTVTGYHKNCDGTAADMRPPAAGEKVVGGYFLQDRPAEKEAEANLAGAEVTLHDHKSATETSALLWEAALAPVTFKTGDGRTFTLKLTRETFELPFNVTLNRFTHEFHPGTRRPKVFESDITKREDGIDQEVKIEMNQPLRRRGYTLFQASWGPENWTPAMGRAKLYSVFAVVKNPSDQWPQYALMTAAFGLLLHFGMKLFSAISRATTKEVKS